MSDLDTLSRRYQAALDSQRDTKALVSRARNRFAEQLESMEAPQPSRWRFVAPTLAAAMAAGLVAWLAWPDAPLGVTLRSQPDSQAKYVQTASAEDVLDFTDGSEVRVREASELRILDVMPNGSHVALEHGSAHVSVVHRAKTRWLFSAGPYRVHVVGTQFELKWDPATGALKVLMDDGIVEVDGPGLARQRVTSRQTLEAFAEPASAALHLAPETEAAADDTEAEATSVTPSRRRRVHVEKAAPVVAPRPQINGPSWRQLADKGDSMGAMGAAEQAGFSWLSNSMPKGDVLALGDVALKARQPARATEAWQAVRLRFAGTTAAMEAAIRLGHLAAEQEHDDDAAIRWFALAVREGPNAPTAPVALGDWLDVLVRARRTEEARKVAGEYLKRFKNGPDAETARTVLEGQ